MQGAALPGGHLIHHRIGYLGDEGRRHLDTIDLGEMGLNVPGAHASGIEGENASIKTLGLLFAFFDQLWFEAAVALPGGLLRDIPVNGTHRLGTFAITGVTGVLAVAGMFGVAQVCRHLGFQVSLGKALGELLK